MMTQIDWTEGFEINTYKLVCFYFKSFGSVRLSNSYLHLCGWRCNFPRGHFPPGALSGNVFSWFVIYIVCHTYTFTVDDAISQGALPPGALSWNAFSWFMIYIAPHAYTFTVDYAIPWGHYLPGVSPGMYSPDLWFIQYTRLHLYGWRRNLSGGTSPPGAALECVLLTYDDSNRQNRRIWNKYIQTCLFLFQTLRFSPFE